MWFDRDPSETPQRQESGEQLDGECRGSMSAMPQGGPYAGRNMGARQGGIGCLQGLQPNVSAEADSSIFHLQQGMLVGMGPDQRRETLEFAPRVASGVIARVDRLKAIGNGQVPRVAAAAFTMLSDQ